VKLLRALTIAVLVGWSSIRTLAAFARHPHRRTLDAGVVAMLQTLGPTFVKFGQIASARTDLLPAGLCSELARLHDTVRPLSPRTAARALDQPQLAGLAVDPEPVGSGSIACVYRAVAPDGSEIALKLKRPNIDRRMRADLGLLAWFARVAGRLPKLRGMPIGDLVDYMSAAILGQLDFEREAANSRRMRTSLAGVAHVVVPRVLDDLSSPTCLAFDFIPDLDVTTPAHLPRIARRRVGTAALTAVHKLFFEDGFVHCDLHPGNLYVTHDLKVVVLDAGYCVQLPSDVRELVSEFFASLARGDGRRCGEIVLASAVDVPTWLDRRAFAAAFDELVRRHASFSMAAFGDDVYELQQTYGIYARSDFAFPLMALLVADATVRRVSADVDFRLLGQTPHSYGRATHAAQARRSSAVHAVRSVGRND